MTSRSSVRAKASADQRPSDWITVHRSGIHGRGVFARRFIPKGTRVIEYRGEKISKAESRRRAEADWEAFRKKKKKGAVYIFELNKRYDIDGDVPYNTARLINHSCDPNCETDIIRGRIWIIAKRDIQPGEEITYNYGYGYEEFEDHPCRCGSPRCVGYILAEEHWPKLKRRLSRRAQKKKPRSV